MAYQALQVEARAAGHTLCMEVQILLSVLATPIKPLPPQNFKISATEKKVVQPKPYWPYCLRWPCISKFVYFLIDHNLDV